MAEVADDAAKAALHERIIRYLSDNSSWVTSENIFFSWRQIYAHEAACGLDYPNCSYRDDDWTDGYNSYGGGGGQLRYGIAVKVTCKCGLVRDQQLRYSGSHVDLIRGITGLDN